jgi:hypothetical protein
MTKPATLTMLFVLAFLSGELVGQEINKSHHDSLIAIVDNYYDLNLKVFQANSTLSDIKNIFSLFSADFVYIHPRYGGTYSREDLYDGYVTNQKDGRYDGGVTNIIVINRIVGINALVVEKRFVNKVESGVKEGESEMTLFEFKEGSICRIIEYW